MRAKRATLRPRIDEIDDRVLQRRVEISGAEEKPIDVGLTVMPFHMKDFGGDPSRRLQACDIAMCQLLDRPTGAIAQNHHLGLLRRGIDIDDEFSVAGDSSHVIGVFGGTFGEQAVRVMEMINMPQPVIILRIIMVPSRKNNMEITTQFLS